MPRTTPRPLPAERVIEPKSARRKRALRVIFVASVVLALAIIGERLYQAYGPPLDQLNPFAKWGEATPAAAPPPPPPTVIRGGHK